MHKLSSTAQQTEVLRDRKKLEMFTFYTTATKEFDLMGTIEISSNEGTDRCGKVWRKVQSLKKANAPKQARKYERNGGMTLNGRQFQKRFEVGLVTMGDLKGAFDRGFAAFEAGKPLRVPLSEIVAVSTGVIGSSLPYANAWSKGWQRAQQLAFGELALELILSGS